MRALHRWPGLLAFILLAALGVSGAALSVFPAAERIAATQAEAALSVAELASRIQQAYPGVEQIRRSPSGRITAYWFENDAPGAAVIDPATGRAAASADPNPVQRWLTTLHRSLFMGDGGRLVAASGAVLMLALSISGMFLVARRAGGWRRWFSPLRGPFAGRIHTEIARIAVAGLMLSAVTAIWMSASTFDLLPAGRSQQTPAAVSGTTGAAVGAIGILINTKVADFRELSFPAADDASDVYTLKTATGEGVIDQGTGALLAWTDLTLVERVSDAARMLHTGQGAALLGLFLGVMALAVPAMGGTGLLMWLAARRARPRIRGNAAANQSETILLVGSEGGSSWGFAGALHQALQAAGQSVHLGPMSAFAPHRYAAARRIIIMAATYGNGEAPASAKGFLERLRALEYSPPVSLAVLGFGDSSFPGFCAYAREISQLARERGWSELIPFATVDRQSPQDFARWSRALGEALGVPLDVAYQPAAPACAPLTLVSRRDYGAEVQAPAAILRFALPGASLWQRLTGTGFTRFSAGDLLGVVPQGSAVPRFYSLASARRDGFIEIAVRKHPGGLCSGQLMALEPGGRISAFLKPNPTFHPGRSQKPLILIGAGTGIGPLAGFIRGNAARRPVYLFFGMRDRASDFLYGDDLARWGEEGRLSRLFTAVSRGERPHYVQDALRAEALHVAQLIRGGARIMVCGGRGMAAGVGEALAEILAPMNLTLLKLKAEGRYVEDVY